MNDNRIANGERIKLKTKEFFLWLTGWYVMRINVRCLKVTCISNEKSESATYNNMHNTHSIIRIYWLAVMYIHSSYCSCFIFFYSWQFKFMKYCELQLLHQSNIFNVLIIPWPHSFLQILWSKARFPFTVFGVLYTSFTFNLDSISVYEIQRKYHIFSRMLIQVLSAINADVSQVIPWYPRVLCAHLPLQYTLEIWMFWKRFIMHYELVRLSPQLFQFNLFHPFHRYF